MKGRGGSAGSGMCSLEVCGGSPLVNINALARLHLNGLTDQVREVPGDELVCSFALFL